MPEVRQRAHDFYTRFITMVGEMERALKKSGDDQKRIVRILGITDSKFITMPHAIFNSLEAAATMDALLSKLGGYWDHFNYYPLEKIIMGIKGCHDLKEHMKCYVREMDHFRRHTEIKVYCEAIEGKNTYIEDVPEGFKKEEWREKNLKTLDDVETFRRRKAYEYRLHECLVFCKHIGLGSTIITLWIPLCEENDNEEVVEAEDSDVDENQESSVAPRPYSLISSVSSVVTKYVFDPFVSS